ncbi:MAG: MFS transporter [Dehalococcoidia bacterium]|nr:MFS transporter [Dehalococcoidia bacterium]
MLERIRSSIASSPSYKWWAFIALGIGTFQSVIAHNSIIVVLPVIADYFDTDMSTVQWVVLAELLVLSCLLMPMGRLSDIVGRKQVYTVGLVVFLTGLTLAGLSNSISSLVMAKTLQGVGSAMSQGTAMAMIVSSFPGAERGKALGLNMSVVGTGGITGPVVGGILAGTLGWRWVFLSSIPVGIIALIVAFVVLDPRLYARDAQRPKFDWLGAALSTGTLLALLLTVTNGHRLGWDSAPIVGGALGFIALIVTFIWWELRTEAPMLDLRLFGSRLFAMGVSAGFIAFMGMHWMRFVMPFYLHGVMGYSISQVGLIMVPNAIAMILMGPMAGRLSDRYGWGRFNGAGSLMSATGIFLLAFFVDRSAPLGFLILAMVLQSSGTGIFNSPNHTSVLSTVDPRRYGVVSGLLSLSRTSAQTVSIALATVAVTLSMAAAGYAVNVGDILDSQDPALLNAFAQATEVALLVLGGLLLIAVTLSILKGGRPAAVVAESVSEPEPAPVPEAQKSPAD